MNYFKDSELACHCGCGSMPQASMVSKLNEIRAAYGKPISVTNVKRCQKHNDTMVPPGAKNSAHVEGIAADLVRTPELFKFIVDNAVRFNIWIEDPTKTPSWIHIDLRRRDPVNRIFKI